MLRVVTFDESPALKERTGEAASDVPDAETRIEHIANMWALSAVERGQADAGKEVCHGDAYRSVGADHGLLGLHDIRAPPEQIRRQADRSIRHSLISQHNATYGLFRISAHQNAYCVLLLNSRALQCGNIGNTRIVCSLCAFDW